MARMTRGGGAAAPDPALEAKRAILYLRALQAVRTSDPGTVGDRTLARLRMGPGGLGIGGVSQQEARGTNDAQMTALMAGLENLRKRIGQNASSIYTQPF